MEEVETLKRDKNVLMMELVHLRQKQSVGLLFLACATPYSTKFSCWRRMFQLRFERCLATANRASHGGAPSVVH